MSNFDDNDLRDAFAHDREPAHLATAGDEGLFEQVAATFRSRMRAWIIVTWVGALLLTAVFVWAVYSFFNADATRDHILYAALALFAMMAIGHIKLWYYMEMNKNTHTREIKRLELQIAGLRRAAGAGQNT